MKVWDYKTIQRAENELLTDEQMNELGHRGYQLISVLAITDHVTVVGRSEERKRVHYFFARGARVPDAAS